MHLKISVYISFQSKNYFDSCYTVAKHKHCIECKERKFTPFTCDASDVFF